MSSAGSATSTSLGALLNASGSRRVIWLDWLRYACRLFGAGEEVWSDPARYLELSRQAQRLLGSEVVEVGLGGFYRAAVGGEGVAAVRGKRVDLALRRLLGVDNARTVAVQVVEGLRVLFPQTPVVLVVDCGLRWLAWAAQIAGDDPDPDFDDDDLDDSAVYVAEAVRAFAASGVAGIVIDTRPDSGHALRDILELHRPILNLAAHYGWPVGAVVSRLEAADSVEGSLDVCLCPDADFTALGDIHAGVRIGGALGGQFWTSDVTAEFPDHAMCYGEIPPDANPETVLARLKQLRAGA